MAWLWGTHVLPGLPKLRENVDGVELPQKREDRAAMAR